MNWPTLNEQTQVLVQGITGKEGSRMTAWMIASGTNVVAGVTPGGAGKMVEGRPVFNTVADARVQFPEANVSCIVVPGPHVLSAAREAIENGITLIHIITERVPLHDVLQMRALTVTRNVTIIGPSSVGFLQFPRFRLGYLGGEQPFASLKEGGLAVISSSGGMTNETLMALARQGTGVRMALAVGGDMISGTSLTDAIALADAQPNVTAIAVFAEPGNPLLRGLISGTVKPHKPLVICLPGDALESLPRGLPYGHAGTILGEEDPSLTEVRTQLTNAGYRCTARHDEFIRWCATL